MAVESKRVRKNNLNVDYTKTYSLQEAIEVLKSSEGIKFDQTVEVSIKMGIDPKKSDQQVRGTVSMPHGIGKSRIIVVIASGDKVQEALESGADFAGSEDILEKIKGGWVDFDALVATPDMMREIGKLGKILGPRGLMPTPRAGSVTNDVSKAIKELQKGKIEFKTNRSGVLNNGVGKLSFDGSSLIENIQHYISAVAKAKPPTAKGQFFVSFVLSSTMGPGLKIDNKELAIS